MMSAEKSGLGTLVREYIREFEGFPEGLLVVLDELGWGHRLEQSRQYHERRLNQLGADYVRGYQRFYPDRSVKGMRVTSLGKKFELELPRGKGNVMLNMDRSIIWSDKVISGLRGGDLMYSDKDMLEAWMVREFKRGLHGIEREAMKRFRVFNDEFTAPYGVFLSRETLDRV